MFRRPWDDPEGARFGARRVLMGLLAITIAGSLWWAAEEIRLSLSVLRAFGANTPYLMMLASVVVAILGCIWLFGGALRLVRSLLDRR